MGGGDLNMKKHFHPLTMQNLERVWKAEQKAKDEAEKLEQLQRELEEERRREALQQHAIQQGIVKKKNEKLDWMYAGPQVNHEEYLLGRKIDKNVEILKEDDKPNEQPGASFVVDISDPVKDMAAKIKEDPLFLIRKKEEESKKELVTNPIKLRKLKEMLNLSVKEQKKNKKSKKSKRKRDKKEKKRRHETDSSSEEDRKEDRRKVRREDRKEDRGEVRREDRRKDGREDYRIRRKKERDYHSTENGYDRRKMHRNEDDGREIRSRRKRSNSSSLDDSEEADSRGRRYDNKRRDNVRKEKSKHVIRREEHHKEQAWERRKERERESSPEEDRFIGRGLTEKSAKHAPASYGKERVGMKYPRKNSSSDEESDSSEDEVRTAKEDSNFNGHAPSNRRVSGDKESKVNYGLYHPKAHNDAGGNVGKARNFSSEPKQRDGGKRHEKESKVKVRRRHDTSPDSSSESSSDDRHHSRKNGHIAEKESSIYKRANGGREVKKSNGLPRRTISDVSRKLTQEELEKKRKEMMDNAKWRDDQRGKNIKKYKMEEEEEASEDRKRAVSPDSKAKFIHDLQVKSYSSSQTSSVEDRIKRNIYTKQRTRDSLGKKFTEK